MSLLERLTSPGPKRMLALDGGGVRGAATLGYLERMEDLLRTRHGRADLRLCDYFDLIGGTSTGSIIAAGLAIGMTASELKEMYLRLGEKVFSTNRLWNRHKASFKPTALRRELQRVFGDRTLGDDSLLTGLCVVAKRADTGSTWPLINHPHGAYYRHNRGMLLRQVIRASTAAPTYFEPEKVDVGGGQVGAFVDGGVSMANNPALQLFLLATLKGYPFHWEAGADQLLLVSVGTGVWETATHVDAVTGYWKLGWAKRVPSMLMDDASWQNQLLLQCLSRPLNPWTIDGEVGEGSPLGAVPLLTYVRYNVRLERNPLNELGLASLADRLATLREMSAGRNVASLALIGERAAKGDVLETHFPAVFNLPASFRSPADGILI